MSRPRLLDAFCGQGGAAMGYHQAGFDVVGVDIDPQPNYPFEFVQGDAITYIREHGHEFDARHASPPCQRWTHGNVAGDQAEKHLDLITPTREALIATGKPYVIENVPRSPLLNPTVLCGTMFGLATTDDDGTMLHLKRHRLFETSFDLPQPPDGPHPRRYQWAGAYGAARRDKYEARNVRKGGYVPPAHVLKRLLGIDWMDEAGMFQSIPPAYAEHVGNALTQHLSSAMIHL